MALLSGIASLDDVEVQHKRVFVRADLDVPVNRRGEVLDDSRLLHLAALIRRLHESEARVVVASRFTGPKRPAPTGNDAASIEPVAARLTELCGVEVHLPDDCIGESVKKVVGDLRAGQICVLENLLRQDGDEQNEEVFARALLPYCDVYIADSLRDLALDSATTTLLPRLAEVRAISPRLRDELEGIARVTDHLERPFTFVLGGTKLTDKLELIHALRPAFDHLCLVGVPANTVLAAQGRPLGRSNVEDDYLAGARTLIEQTYSHLVIPEDFVVADSAKASSGRVVPAGRLGPEDTALDLGPRSLDAIRAKVAASQTVLWVGTVGFHKNDAFAAGTRSLIEALAESSAFTIVAGDDSVAAARATCPDRADSLGLLSGGGRATLALLAGKKLPGLTALRGMTDD